MEKRSGNRAFARSAATMLVGTIAAQVITLLTMPILTRIYPPEAIGAQALFVSISGAAIIVATMRLDLAVVLPKRDETAENLVTLVFYQSLVVAIVVLAGVYVFSYPLGMTVGGQLAPAWLWLLAPMIVIGAVANAGLGMATRWGRFATLVSANVVLSVAFAVSAVVIGLIRPGNNGVVIARFIGQGCCLVVLLATGLVVTRQLLRVSTLREGRSLLHDQRQFLIFNTPYSLVGNLARDLPLYIFAAFGGTALVASYALARAITLAPVSLASATLSKVFYREAALHWGTPRLEKLMGDLTRIGLCVSLPAFAFLAVWGDRLFTVAFGTRWEQAGQFAQLLSVPLWLALQTGWPERMFEVARKQNISFAIQLSFDAVHALIICAVYWQTKDPLVTVGSYAVSYSAYQIVYLGAVYKVARFDVFGLVRMIAWNAVAMVLVVSALFAVRTWSPLSVPADLALSGMVVGAATVGVALNALGRLKATMPTVEASVSEKGCS